MPQRETELESEKNESEKEMQRKIVSCGVRTHAQLPAMDLKSTPLTTRANRPAGAQEWRIRWESDTAKSDCVENCSRKARQSLSASTCGLVAMTSASHAEGRQFDPGQVYFFHSSAQCCWRLQNGALSHRLRPLGQSVNELDHSGRTVMRVRIWPLPSTLPARGR